MIDVTNQLSTAVIAALTGMIVSGQAVPAVSVPSKSTGYPYARLHSISDNPDNTLSEEIHNVTFIIDLITIGSSKKLQNEIANEVFARLIPDQVSTLDLNDPALKMISIVFENGTEFEEQTQSGRLNRKILRFRTTIEEV